MLIWKECHNFSKGVCAGCKKKAHFSTMRRLSTIFILLRLAYIFCCSLQLFCCCQEPNEAAETRIQWLLNIRGQHLTHHSKNILNQLKLLLHAFYRVAFAYHLLEIKSQLAEVYGIFKHFSYSATKQTPNKLNPINLLSLTRFK